MVLPVAAGQEAYAVDPVCFMAMPVAGLCGFLVRPALWRHVMIPFFFTLVILIISLVVLFGGALAPQVHLLEHWGWASWVSWLTATIAVLIESSLVSLIVFLVFFGCMQPNITYAVLEERGVLERMRQELGVEEIPELSCFRGLNHAILFLVGRLPILIVSLPLLLVPVLGQIAFPALNGWLYAWELQGDFLPILGRKRCGQQLAHVRQHCGAYASFGFIAMLLELVPVVNILFLAGNAVGAAFFFEAMLPPVGMGPLAQGRQLTPPV